MSMTHDPPELSRPETEIPARERGIRSLRAGDPQAALEHLRAAVRADPDDVEAHAYLGVAYGRLHMLAEAADCLTDAVRLAPASAPLRYNLGRALEQLGKQEEARAAYEQALIFDAGYERAREALARLPAPPVEAVEPEPAPSPLVDAPALVEPAPEPEPPALAVEAPEDASPVDPEPATTLAATCDAPSTSEVDPQGSAPTQQPAPELRDSPRKIVRNEDVAIPSRARAVPRDRRRSTALVGFSIFLVIWGAALGVLCWALCQPDTSQLPVQSVAASPPQTRQETPVTANGPQPAAPTGPSAVTGNTPPETAATAANNPSANGTAAPDAPTPNATTRSAGTPPTPNAPAALSPAAASAPPEVGSLEAKLRSTIARADALEHSYKQRAEGYRQDATRDAKPGEPAADAQSGYAQMAEFLLAQGQKAHAYGDQARYDLAELLSKLSRREEALPLFQAVADSNAAPDALRERSNQRLQELLHE